MFVYAIAKALRQGYLPVDPYRAAVEKGYSGILNEFVTVDERGLVNLNQMCYVAGLGGDPYYRDGSFENYIGERVVSNDFKGVGPFILASIEMEN
jgi:unsaturated rhamnogalacturonyl hydrolase